MKFKKISMRLIALALALLCGVTAAFAAGLPEDSAPDDNIRGSCKYAAPHIGSIRKFYMDGRPTTAGGSEDLPIIYTMFHTVHNGYLALVDARLGHYQPFIEGLVEATPEQISEYFLPDTQFCIEFLAKNCDGWEDFSLVSLEDSVQSDCPHINLLPNTMVSHVSLSEDEHLTILTEYNRCEDCHTGWIIDRTTEINPHSFHPDQYAGADHSAAGPAGHYYIYQRKCSGCWFLSLFAVPTLCTNHGCAEFD